MEPRQWFQEESMCVTITNNSIAGARDFATPEEISMGIEDNMLDLALGLNPTRNDPVLISMRSLIPSSLTQDPVLNSVLGSVLTIIPDSAEGLIPDSLLEAIVDSVPEPCLWIGEETDWTMT